MLTVLITWMVAAVCTTAWGAALCRWLARLSPAEPLPLPSEWLSALGLGLLIAFLQIWSLLWPVADAARVVVTGIALLSAVWQRQAIQQWAKQARQHLKTANLWRWALGSLLLVWVLVYASQRPMSFDVGLYTLQTLQWTEHYPVVPGLGNLHGRLAFNASWFLPTALFRVLTPVGPAYGLGSYPFALLAVAVGRAWNEGGRHRQRSGTAWAALLLMLLLLYPFQSRLSSALTDGPAAALAALLFLRYTTHWRAEASRLTVSEALATVLLAVTLVTMKLSVLPVLGLAAHALWTVRWKLVTDGRWAVPLATVAVLVLPWLARNVVLSGYLVYPLPALDWLALDWKVPLEAARIEQRLIVNLARNVPHAVAAAAPETALAAWVPTWWRLSLPFQQAVFILAAGSVLPAVGRWRRGVPLTQTGWAVGWLVAWLGGWFWLLSAPDFRFGLLFLLVAALWPWLAARPLLPSGWLRSALVVALLLWVGQQMRDPVYHLRTSPRRFATRVLWPEPVPQMLTELVPIKGGQIRVPRTGLQCYGAPLPCAPCTEANLRARGASWRNGFRRGN
ncbi:LIC_10190 family membrane protein [Hymenobacter koreensis]|uniref:DUF8201 domain-containing protein n=1 Tax=Hymenobacter koreensis TaxID=1084523 RepID=A0ABP8ITV4_9BACT